jgi:hypothetical protein
LIIAKRKSKNEPPAKLYEVQSFNFLIVTYSIIVL